MTYWNDGLWELYYVYTALQKFGITLISWSNRGIHVTQMSILQDYNMDYFKISYDKC